MNPQVQSAAGKVLALALLTLGSGGAAFAQASQSPVAEAYQMAWLDYLVANGCEATAGELWEVHQATLRQFKVRGLGSMTDSLLAFKGRGQQARTYVVEIDQRDFTVVRPDEMVRLSNWKGCE